MSVVELSFYNDFNGEVKLISLTLVKDTPICLRCSSRAAIQRSLDFILLYSFYIIFCNYWIVGSLFILGLFFIF
jgi:hypothetical protein